MYLAAVSVKNIAIISTAVVVWFGAAFYAAGYARNNGGDYSLWIIIGIITGPVGLIAALVYYGLAGETQQRSRHSVKGSHDIPEMVPCPDCKEMVPSGFDACQFCGAELTRRRRS